MVNNKLMRHSVETKDTEDLAGSKRLMHLSMVCPRMGGSGNPGEIWHFQVSKCQFPHPWVSIISQIPTFGDHKLYFL